VLGLVLRVGREFGLRAVRVPREHPWRAWQASRKRLLPKLASWLFLAPWTALMRRQLRRAGLQFNDFVFGLCDSGEMNRDLVVQMLHHLPDGVTELFFHPATRRCLEIDRTMATYHHEQELQALVSPLVGEVMQRAGIERIAFVDL
jgi:hypothetical protein